MKLAGKRTLSLLLAGMLVITAALPAAAAETEQITGFLLDETVLKQTVKAGTPEENLDLPETLEGVVESAVNDGDAAGPGTVEVTGVVWESEPSYDPDEPGDYLFVPDWDKIELPDGYALADEADAEIEVTVEALLTVNGLETETSDSLEEGNGITRKGAGLKVLPSCGQVLEISAGWNNQNQGHAEFTNPEDLFKKTAFTLLADVNFTVESGNNKPAAFTIGTAENGIRALTASGGLGYGKLTSGDAEHLAESDPAPMTGWNTLALVYEEKDGANGAATLYLNGELAAVAEDIGFKLSETDDIQGLIGRSFGTNFLLNGFYDNIVVTDTAMSAEEAEEATNERAAAKEGVSVDDAIIPIVVDGEDVDAAAQNVNGLTFKGWGVLNGNSTSNLLLDYKSESPDQYWEMMEVLFGGERPLMTHIKMEMGNDGNNSTGADACTMRSADEEADASRSPGFAMAADAKKINPDVKVSMLYWELPSWVASDWNRDKTGAGYEALYKWYRETIFDAYEKYGYVVDYVNPDKNETSSPDADRIVWFANKLASEEDFPDYFTEEAKEAYHSIKIIASDENGSLNIVPKMRASEDLYNAVDAIGFHYRSSATDDYIKMADVDDKEIWYSEACATFGYTELTENRNDPAYGAGTLGGWRSSIAMIDGFLNSFACSRRTLFIFQPAIGAFYEGIQYAHKELLGARDPWSGHIHYDPALYMIGHVSKFAVTGWENEENSAGIWRAIPQASFASYGGSGDAHATPGEDGSASYMTLAAPDKSDFSVVFTNNTQNEKTYWISPDGVAEDTDELQLWETYTDHYMENGGTAERSEDGGFTVTIPAYSVVTATTLTAEEASMEPLPPDIKGRDVLDTDESGRERKIADNYLYADDFEYGEEPPVEVYHLENGDSTATDYLESRGNEPRYMVDSHGAWAVENGRLEQALSSSVGQWNGGDPMTIVGDFRWMNYKAGIDVDFSNVGDSDWGGIGMRSQRGMNWNEDGYTLHIQKDGNWNFYRAGSKLSSGKVTSKSSYRLEVEAKGNLVTACVDGETVFTYTDQTPMEMGRVKLSCAWKNVAFDNFTVETVPGYIPYATAMFDNLDDVMDYEGDWTLQGPGPGSADDWYRTLSWNDESNASVTFPIEGTGFMLTGTNDGTAKLDVYIDDMESPVATDTATLASARHYSAYTCGGLENSSHTVKIVVKSGKLTLDAVYSLGEATPGGGLEGLQALIDQYKDLTQGDYTEESWTVFAQTLAAAQQLIDESEQSQIKIDQAAASLQDAYQKLLARDTPVEITTSLPQIVAVAAGSAIEGLPDKVAVKTADGGSAEADIIWDNEAERFSTPFQSVSVTGTVEGGRTTEGAPLTVTIPVEVISENSAGLKYFVDCGTGPDWADPPAGADKVNIVNSLAYQTVAALDGVNLLNGLSDQIFNMQGETDNLWGAVVGVRKSNNSRTDPLRSPDGQPAGDSTDKYAMGLRTGNDSISYKLTLDPGVYRLDTGCTNDWYPGRTRNFTPVITYVRGEEEISITLDAISLPNDTLTQREFILPAHDGPITLTYQQTGGEAPVLSFFAVTAKAADPTDSQAVQNAKEILESALPSPRLDQADANSKDTVAAKLEEQINALEGFADTGVTAKVAFASFIPAVAGTGLDKDGTDGSFSYSVLLCRGGALDEVVGKSGVIDATEFVYVPYTSLSGTRGDSEAQVWKDDNGTHIQAHGGQVQWLDVLDLNEDGISEGGWIWYGEDKTSNGNDGIHCYTSSDLYNWTDRGRVMYTHNQRPVELDSNAEKGWSVTYEPLDNLKAWAKMEAPTEQVTQDQIDEAKNFLAAYTNEDGTYDDEALDFAYRYLFKDTSVVERPKMLYNEKTKKYVLVYHQDGICYDEADLIADKDDMDGDGDTTELVPYNRMLIWLNGGSVSKYGLASMGFAVSDTPYGPFKLVNVQRMNQLSEDDYPDVYKNKPAMARDMNVFLDKGVDADKNGVDDAYAIYSSEENAKMYVSLLNETYTGPAIQTDVTDNMMTLDDGTKVQGFAGRVLPENSREAPAIFKFNGYYYMITSGTSGWSPNKSTYYRAESIFGPYEAMGDPCVDDAAGKTFYTQSTCVIPVDEEAGKFIYMGDRWIASELSTSGYVWLPIKLNVDGAIAVSSYEDWTLDALEDMNPIRDTVYFVDSGATETDGYFSRVADAAAGMKNPETPDQAYIKGFWGYEGDNTGGRTKDDLYGTLRYVNSGSEERNLSYRFDDLESGTYSVYVGFYDPWYQYSKDKRVAKVSVNVGGVQSGSAQTHTITDSKKALAFSNVKVDQNGSSLQVLISPENTGENTDVQVSFIAICKASAGTPVENSITIAETANGILSVDKAAAAEDETVTVTAIPDQGCRLVENSLSVYRTDDGNTEVAVTEVSDGVYTFTMPGYAVTVTAEFETIPAPGTPSLSKTRLTLKVGGTAVLKVQNAPEGAEISWSSSNESVAAVNGGKVSALAAGKATITANVGGTALTCEVTVTKRPSGDGGGSSGGSSGGSRTVVASGQPAAGKPVVSVQNDPQGKPVITVNASPLPDAKPLTAAEIAKKAADGTLNAAVNPNGIWDGRTTGVNNAALVIDTREAALTPGGSYQLGVSAFAGPADYTLRVRASRGGFVTIVANQDGTYTITADRPVADLYILVEILDANGSVVGHSSMKLNAAAGLTPGRVENRAATIA